MLKQVIAHIKNNYAKNACVIASKVAAGNPIHELLLLGKFANVFDRDGLHKAAEEIDKSLSLVAKMPNDSKKMEALYDSEKRNERLFITAPETLNRKVRADPTLGGLIEMSPQLSSRYCPDYPGVQMLRVTDGVYQCSMTGKIYDFNNGWTSDITGKSYSGSKVTAVLPTDPIVTTFNRILNDHSDTTAR